MKQQSSFEHRFVATKAKTDTQCDTQLSLLKRKNSNLLDQANIFPYPELREIHFRSFNKREMTQLLLKCRHICLEDTK